MNGVRRVAGILQPPKSQTHKKERLVHKCLWIRWTGTRGTYPGERFEVPAPRTRACPWREERGRPPRLHRRRQTLPPTWRRPREERKRRVSLDKEQGNGARVACGAEAEDVVVHGQKILASRSRPRPPRAEPRSWLFLFFVGGFLPGVISHKIKFTYFLSGRPSDRPGELPVLQHFRDLDWSPYEKSSLGVPVPLPRREIRGFAQRKERSPEKRTKRPPAHPRHHNTATRSRTFARERVRPKSTNPAAVHAARLHRRVLVGVYSSSHEGVTDYFTRKVDGFPLLSPIVAEVQQQQATVELYTSARVFRWRTSAARPSASSSRASRCRSSSARAAMALCK